MQFLQLLALTTLLTPSIFAFPTPNPSSLSSLLPRDHPSLSHEAHALSSPAHKRATPELTIAKDKKKELTESKKSSSEPKDESASVVQTRGLEEEKAEKAAKPKLTKEEKLAKAQKLVANEKKKAQIAKNRKVLGWLSAGGKREVIDLE